VHPGGNAATAGVSDATFLTISKFEKQEIEK
jgi:hypothetical protein